MVLSLGGGSLAAWRLHTCVHMVLGTPVGHARGPSPTVWVPRFGAWSVFSH